MTTTTFIIVTIVLFGLYQFGLWTWNHPTEWTALQEKFKNLFRKK